MQERNGRGRGSSFFLQNIFEDLCWNCISLFQEYLIGSRSLIEVKEKIIRLEVELGLGNFNFNELCYTTSSMMRTQKGNHIIGNSMVKLETILENLFMGWKSPTMWLTSTIKGPIITTWVAWFSSMVRSSWIFSMEHNANVLQGALGIGIHKLHNYFSIWINSRNLYPFLAHSSSSYIDQYMSLFGID